MDAPSGFPREPSYLCTERENDKSNRKSGGAEEAGNALPSFSRTSVT